MAFAQKHRNATSLMEIRLPERMPVCASRKYHANTATTAHRLLTFHSSSSAAVASPRRNSYHTSSTGLIKTRRLNSIATTSSSSSREDEKQEPTTAPAVDQTEKESQRQQPLAGRSNAVLVLSIAAVVVLGIGNRLLYKMALAPLGNYVFFLAQLQTFGYVAVYFLALAVRYRAGLVSPAMLSLPRRMSGTFMAIGFVEAISSLLSFISAANLPGVVLPLLSQTVLFWQVLFATVLLKKRLGRWQLGGVALVVAGVALAAWPSSSSSSSASILANVNPVYAWIFVFSMLFPALDTIFKERVFKQWRDEVQVVGDGDKNSDKSSSSSSDDAPKKRDLDLFVLNSFGSLAQALFVFALLPLITSARGMALADLPSYLSAGWQCCRGITPPCGADCSGAPLIPILYVVFNLGFNVAVLRVIRQAGNVAISLIMSAII